MTDITGDQGFFEGQPVDTTQQEPITPKEDKEDKKIDRSAGKSAERASETIRRYDADHDIFTK